MNNLVDAKKSLEFEIGQTHVPAAKRHDKNYCVIAQALKQIPGIKFCEVGASIVRIWRGQTITRYRTPAFLKHALMLFDETGSWQLQDGTYQLDPPSPHDSLPQIRTRERVYKTRKRNGYHKTGRNTLKHINPRVIEFAKMRKERNGQ